jgi:hypothetical protein
MNTATKWSKAGRILQTSEQILVDEAERLKQKVEASEHALRTIGEEPGGSLETSRTSWSSGSDLNMRVAPRMTGWRNPTWPSSRSSGGYRINCSPSAVSRAAGVWCWMCNACAWKEGAFAMLATLRRGEPRVIRRSGTRTGKVHLTVLNAADSLATYGPRDRRNFGEDAAGAGGLAHSHLKNQSSTVLRREWDSDGALSFGREAHEGNEHHAEYQPGQLRLVEAPMLPDTPEMRKKVMVMVLGLLADSCSGAGVC